MDKNKFKLKEKMKNKGEINWHFFTENAKFGDAREWEQEGYSC